MPTAAGSGLFHARLVHQQDGDVVADGVDAMAGCALQPVSGRGERQRLAARGTGEDLEQVLGKHGMELYDKPGAKICD